MFVFHIGLKKSGSASIQTFFAANQDALRALSVDYASAGRGNRKEHHNLARDAMGAASFDPSQGSLAQLAEAAADPAMARVVVSSEMFEGCGGAHVARIKQALGAVGREFRIVLIIRDLLELIPSSYAQKIRYGMSVFDFDTFFDARMQEKRVDYYETVRRWAEVFGWDAVRIRPLDRRYLKNGDLIDDFLDCADVDLLDPAVMALHRPGQVNTAAGWKTLEALCALYSGRHGLPADHPLLTSRDAHSRRQGKAIEAAARQFGDSLGWNDDRGRYFTRDQAERVLEINAAAVAGLNARLPMALPTPLSLDERGFVDREFIPDVSRIPPGELRAFYDGLAATMVEGKFPPTERDTRRAEARAERKRLRKMGSAGG